MNPARDDEGHRHGPDFVFQAADAGVSALFCEGQGGAAVTSLGGRDDERLFFLLRSIAGGEVRLLALALRLDQQTDRRLRRAEEF